MKQAKMTRSGAAVFAALVITLGACGSGETSVVESMRAERETLVESYNDRIEQLDALMGSYNNRVVELDASRSALDAVEEELNEASVVAVAAVDERNDLVQQVERLREFEKLSKDQAGSITGLQREVAALQADMESLLLAFDEDLIDLRLALDENAESVGCQLGTERASEGLSKRPVSLADLAGRISTDGVLLSQLEIAVDIGGIDASQALSAATESSRSCYEARAAEVAAERLDEERQQLAAVLPIVCDFERHDGNYVDIDGFVNRTFNLRTRTSDRRGYVQLVFSGYSVLPGGWAESEVVLAESDRCASLPRRVLGSGTRLVGEEIETGTYRSLEPVRSACYWARYRPNGNIRANQFTESAAAITISVSSSDYSVENDGCGLLVKGRLRTEVDAGE